MCACEMSAYSAAMTSGADTENYNFAGWCHRMAVMSILMAFCGVMLLITGVNFWWKDTIQVFESIVTDYQYPSVDCLFIKIIEILVCHIHIQESQENTYIGPILDDRLKENSWKPERVPSVVILSLRPSVFSHTMPKMDFHYSHRFSWEKKLTKLVYLIAW